LGFTIKDVDFFFCREYQDRALVLSGNVPVFAATIYREGTTGNNYATG